MAFSRPDGEPADVRLADMHRDLVAVAARLGLVDAPAALDGMVVPASQARAVSTLFAEGPTNQRDLGYLLELERSTVSRLVDRLRDRGWVATHPAGYGRGVIVELTPEGRSAAVSTQQAVAGRFSATLGELPLAARADVTAAFEVLIAALSRDAHADERREAS